MRRVDYKQNISIIKKITFLLLFLFFLSIPLQFGPHFWPDFSIIDGIRVDYLSPTIYPSDICILFLFILFTFQIKNPSFLSIKKILVSHLSLLIFFLLLIIGLLLSENKGVGLYGLFKLCEFIFLGFFMIKNFSITVLRTLFMRALLIGLVFQSILVFMQFDMQESVNGIFYYFGERNFTSQTIGIANASINGQLIVRPYGTFSHPNVLAGFILISLTMLLALNIRGKYKIFFWMVIIFLGSLALILTLSRIVIIMWICIYIFSVIIFLKQKKFKLFSLFLLCVLILILFLTPFRERFTMFFISDDSITKRYEQFKTSFQIIQNHPFFGVGLNNYFNYINDYATAKNYYELQPVHNVYLLTASQTGIAGLFFLLLFFFKTYKRLTQKIIEFKNTKNHAFYISLSMVFWAVLLLGLFDHYFFTLQQGQLIFTSIFAMIWAKERL